jgi:mannose-6-phosphate isomerase-like protein (cupin superfamily)
MCAAHRVVVGGEAEVTVGNSTTRYAYGEHISVPEGSNYRIACPAGDSALFIIEVLVFAEMDIARHGQQDSLLATLPHEDRPWGAFYILANLPRTKVKLIVVQPGEILSLQSHEQRAEHWVVADGEAEVTVGEALDKLQIQRHGHGKHVFIPRRAIHRMACPAGNTRLEIVEVQVGDGFDETDITRYDDKYKRV